MKKISEHTHKEEQRYGKFQTMGMAFQNKREARKGLLAADAHLNKLLYHRASSSSTAYGILMWAPGRRADGAGQLWLCREAGASSRGGR